MLQTNKQLRVWSRRSRTTIDSCVYSRGVGGTCYCAARVDLVSMQMVPNYSEVLAYCWA